MPRMTAPVAAVNELARRDPEAIHGYVRLVGELQRIQGRAARGGDAGALRASVSEEKRQLRGLVKQAQVLIGEGGHKADQATAQRLMGLLRDAALRAPRALEKGALASETRAIGWNLPGMLESVPDEPRAARGARVKAKRSVAAVTARPVQTGASGRRTAAERAARAARGRTERLAAAAREKEARKVAARAQAAAARAEKQRLAAAQRARKKAKRTAASAVKIADRAEAAVRVAAERLDTLRSAAQAARRAADEAQARLASLEK